MTLKEIKAKLKKDPSDPGDLWSTPVSPEEIQFLISEVERLERWQKNAAQTLMQTGYLHGITQQQADCWSGALYKIAWDDLCQKEKCWMNVALDALEEGKQIRVKLEGEWGHMFEPKKEKQ